jgi:hypothetical protein
VRPPGRAWALVTAGAALLLAACGGGSADVPEPSPTTSSPSASPTASTTPTAQAAGQMPLTGVPVSSAAALARRAVGVAVQMVPGGRLSGISAADLVYVEFDRSHHARLVAMYQSADATSVGPVTATAPTDPQLLTLFGTPAFAFDGGPTGFVVQAKPPALNPRDAAGPYRSLFRAGAGGLVVSTTALRASQRGGGPPMGGVLTFASDVAPAPTGTKALTRIVVSVPGQDPVAFTWSSGAWSGPGGSRLANIVVQVVAYKTHTPHKSPTVQSAVVTGSGAAAVFAGQHGASTTWSRQFPGTVTVYSIGPRPVGLTPGRSWVLLVPKGTRVTTS